MAFAAHPSPFVASLDRLPDLREGVVSDYRAARLFPLFRNRVINRRRPDLRNYLRALDLTEGADPFEILSTSGGYRATDAYEVFPKLVKGPDGSFNSSAGSSCTDGGMSTGAPRSVWWTPIRTVPGVSRKPAT